MTAIPYTWEDLTGMEPAGDAGVEHLRCLVRLIATNGPCMVPDRLSFFFRQALGPYYAPEDGYPTSRAAQAMIYRLAEALGPMRARSMSVFPGEFGGPDICLGDWVWNYTRTHDNIPEVPGDRAAILDMLEP